MCPNKVLCFTRSSQLVHQLPVQYQTFAFSTQDSKDLLNKFVFEETEKLVVCKLTSMVLQSAVEELLRSFILSDKKVCIIIANMQETSQRIINHVRIMIEEAEVLVSDRQKLFILLLHFPPAQYFTPCYPSLFLKGWDHNYLDTIAHCSRKGVIDIRDWIWQCCFPLDSEEECSTTVVLHDMLHEAIPILCSRVVFCNHSSSSPMNSSDRSKVLTKLLFDYGVGPVLCKQFLSYWKPAVMTEMLDRAASFSKSRESTLNIADSVQTRFKSLFFDFVVYMIISINNQNIIDILFDQYDSSVIQKLFLDILDVIPLPPLSQVTVLSTSIQEPHCVSHFPRFPFFAHVSGLIDKLLERSLEEANKKRRIIEDAVNGESRSEEDSSDSIFTALQESFLVRIKEEMQVGTLDDQIL